MNSHSDTVIDIHCVPNGIGGKPTLIPVVTTIGFPVMRRMDHPEKVRYKVIGGEMKGMESSMKLVALGATQRKG